MIELIQMVAQVVIKETIMNKIGYLLLFITLQTPSLAYYGGGYGMQSTYGGGMRPYGMPQMNPYGGMGRPYSYNPQGFGGNFGHAFGQSGVNMGGFTVAPMTYGLGSKVGNGLGYAAGGVAIAGLGVGGLGVGLAGGALYGVGKTFAGTGKFLYKRYRSWRDKDGDGIPDNRDPDGGTKPDSDMDGIDDRVDPDGGRVPSVRRWRPR